MTPDWTRIPVARRWTHFGPESRQDETGLVDGWSLPTTPQACRPWPDPPDPW